jgi:hypothetical protein
VDRRTGVWLVGWVYFQSNEQQLTYCGTDPLNGRLHIHAIKSDQIPHLNTALWGYKSIHKVSRIIKSAEGSKWQYSFKLSPQMITSAGSAVLNQSESGLRLQGTKRAFQRAEKINRPHVTSSSMLIY